MQLKPWFILPFLLAAVLNLKAQEAPWYYTHETGEPENVSFVPLIRLEFKVINPLEEERKNSLVTIERQGFPMPDLHEMWVTVVDPSRPPFEEKKMYIYIGENIQGWNRHMTRAGIGSYCRHLMPFRESEHVGRKIWFANAVDFYAKRKPVLMSQHLYMENLDGYAADQYYSVLAHQSYTTCRTAEEFNHPVRSEFVGRQIKSETWDVDNLQVIGGHSVTIFGDPEVVQTSHGKAVSFDGDGDLLLVDHNPIGKATAFTVEVIFKPNGCFPENTDPRFLHFQDPGDEHAKRLMVELRINKENQCFLDAFLKTDTEDLTLIDETLTHPTETWHHVAVVYERGEMTTYFDGIRELNGQVGFKNQLINPTGKVSIGGRMDQRNWFNGQIRTLRVTPLALDPVEFMVHPTQRAE